MSEPAYLAFEGETLRAGKVVAIGADAEAMLGKMPPHIKVISPMNAGIVTQPYTASMLIKKLIQKAKIQGIFTHRRSIVVGVLLGASEIEERAFLEVASSLGAGRITSVKEPLAAAIGCNIPIDEPYGNMILDVGSGASEAIITSLRKIIAGRSIRVGGQSMDQSIAEHFYRKLNLKISLQMARRVKEKISSLQDDSSTVSVYGIDHSCHMPRMATIKKADIVQALQKPIDEIASMIQSLLAQAGPEISVDLIENGIILCGGGALSCTLQEELMLRTGLQVNIAIEPSRAVARGCTSILDYVDFVQ